MSHCIVSTMAPCSVKAQGNLRRPPRTTFEVANCDIKESNFLSPKPALSVVERDAKVAKGSETG